MKPQLRSRSLDFVLYVAIGLLIVGFTVFAAVKVPDGDLAVQLATAFVSGCMLLAFIVPDYWRKSHRKSLVMFCAVVVILHFGAYLLAFEELGRTKPVVAGLITPFELGLFWWLAGKIIGYKQHS